MANKLIKDYNKQKTSIKQSRLKYLEEKLNKNKEEIKERQDRFEKSRGLEERKRLQRIKVKRYKRIIDGYEAGKIDLS